jgi:hypothetical protein
MCVVPKGKKEIDPYLPKYHVIAKKEYRRQSNRKQNKRGQSDQGTN